VKRGVTLIEMLVAMAITLIMMGAVISVFGLIGNSVGDSRALVEMSERMNSVRGRLQKDLAGVTASMKLNTSPDSESGYFEIIESPGVDKDQLTSGTAGTPGYGVMGDNDTLMFTARSNGEPFTGRITTIDTQGCVQYTTVKSQSAEIMWLVAPTPGRTAPPGTIVPYTLYRRTLVIGGVKPGAVAGVYTPPSASPCSDKTPTVMLEVPGTTGFVPKVFSGNQLTDLPTVQAQAQAFAREVLSSNDVSIREVITSSTTVPKIKISFVANTLSDLTKRENRFLHNLASDFPFPVLLSSGPTSSRPSSPKEGEYFFDTTIAQWSVYELGAWKPNDQGAPVFPPTTPKPNPIRYGDDVILSNVISFDVRVYDPGAPLRIVNGTVIGPSDAGYVDNSSATAYGAYVDLGYPRTADNPAGYPPLQFNSRNYSTYPSGMVLPNYVFDTWSTSYEQNGAGGVAPIGANGLDDPPFGSTVTDGVIDGPDEATFPPPFKIPADGTPLRGIQVKIRCYEPDSRQVREVTVVQDFLPNN